MKVNNVVFNVDGNMFNVYVSVVGVIVVGSGCKNMLYGLVFYYVFKCMEFYVVVDYMKLKDQYIVGGINGYNSQMEFGVGMCMCF